MNHFIYRCFLVLITLLAVHTIASGQCNEPPPTDFPCTADPLCGFADLGGYCLRMTETDVAYGYPGTPLGVCFLHNPNWFAFVAGENFVELEIAILNCIGGDESLQMTVYAGDPDCSTLPPSGLEIVAGDCECIDPGTQTIGFNTIPGQTYYIVFDGCNGALCNVNIRLLQGGNAPEVSDVDAPEELNIPDFEDGPVDTVCQGATDVTLEVPSLYFGTSYLLWEFPDGSLIRGDVRSKTLEVPNVYFEEEGPLEVCVYAANDCDTIGPMCTDYYVKPLEPVFEEAVVCEGDVFDWDLGEMDTDDPGVYNYTATRYGTLGCPYDANLELTVTSENDEQPTEIEEAICFGDVYTHPSGYSTTVGGENIPHVWPGINPGGCDSFFRFDVEVVGGQFIINPPDTCNGDGTITLNSLFLPIGNNVPIDHPELEVDYSWSVNGEPLPDTTESIIVDQDMLEMYPYGSYRMEVSMEYPRIDGPCSFSTNVFEMRLEDYVPRFDSISGPDIVCSGSSAEYRVHFRDPENMYFIDDVETFNWSAPEGVTVIDTGSTINVQVGPDAEEGALCVELVTHCGFKDSGCIPLNINYSIIPDLGPDGSPCDYSFTFSPNAADTGQWLVGDKPLNAQADFDDVNDPATTVTVDSAGTYQFIWKEGEAQCERYDTIEILFNGYPDIENVQLECNDPPTTYTVTFNISGGTPPYELVMGSGTITGSQFVSDPISSGSEYMFQISDAAGCVSQVIEGIKVCDCETDAGSMSDDPLETCGDGCLTAVPNPDEITDIDDLIQFALHEGSGNSLQNVIGIGDDAEFCFVSGMSYGQTYYISRIVGSDDGTGSVDLEDGCLSVAEGQSVVWYEQPEADAGEGMDVCGMEADLNANSGVGQGQWSLVSGPGNALFLMPNSPVSPVTVDAFGTYSFEWQLTNGDCTDADTVQVTFRDEPRIEDGTLVVECLPDLDYVITFQLTGGAPPYDLIQGDGILTGQMYTDTLSGGESYDIAITDSEQCGPLELQGQQDCECSSVAGDMTQVLLDTCYTQCVTAIHLGQDTSDMDDTTAFVLHDSDGDQLGNVIGMNESGTFCYADYANQLTPGQTYYISFIVGNEDGTGSVDLVDPCLAVAPGQPVIFYDEPVIDAGEDDETCGLQYADLSASQSDGEGLWEVLSGPGNAMFDMPVSPQTGVMVDATGTYCFTWTGHYEGCSAGDTVCVTFLDAPEVEPSDIEITCNALNTEYTVTFVIQGGDPGTYQVNGDPGLLNSDTFVSEPIPSGEGFTFLISDGNGCETFELTDAHTCACANEAGNMSLDTVGACPGDTITVAAAENPVLEGGDILKYYLHEGSGTNIQNKIAENSLPSFGFDPDQMNLNQVYYISSVVGNGDGNGNINPEDACLDVATGTPVIWYSRPQAVIDEPIDEITCEMPAVSLDGSPSSSVTGQGLDYQWMTSGGNIVGGTQSPMVEVNRPGIYTLIVTDRGSGCKDSTQASVQVSDETPLAIIEDPDTINCDISAVELDAGGSSTGPDYSIEWSTNPPGLDIENEDSLNPLVTEAGEYILTVTRLSNGCTSRDSVIVVVDTGRPVAVADVDSVLSCTVPWVRLNGSGSSSGTDYRYEWSPTEGMEDQDSLYPNVSQAGTYTLVVTDIGNGCTSSASVTVQRDTSLVEAGTYQARNPNCDGEPTGRIEITGLPGGSPPFSYSLNGGAEQNNTGIFENLNAGSYSVIVRGSIGCRYLIDGIELIEPDPLQVDLPPSLKIERGDSVDLVPEIIPAGRSIASWSWSSPDSTVCDTCNTITASPEETTEYTVTVIDENGCIATERVLIVVEVIHDVYIPNIFTPNSDGINDVFYLQAKQGEVREVRSMEVFDRWGNRVYERNSIPPNAKEHGWDGTKNGQKLTPAVFVYVFEVVFSDGVSEQIEGSITLMR